MKSFVIYTFDVCQVVLREMPSVPGAVVAATGCREAGELESTRHQISADLEMAKRPKRTFAFGSALPKYLRFVPPRNELASKWLRCENIPEDLETMDVVWKDIVHLDSVQSFIGYLKENPKVKEYIEI